MSQTLREPGEGISTDSVQLAPQVVLNEDRWLGERLGYSAYRVNLAESGSKSSASTGDLRQWSHELAHRQTRSFFDAKVDPRRLQWLHDLARAGFQLVDTNVTLQLDSARCQSVRRPGSTEIKISDSNTSDHAAVAQIAAQCFDCSRFHLDPQLDDEVANQIKAAWVENCLSGKRGDRVFVARCGGDIAGFLATIVIDQEAGRCAVIDLVGVARPFQQRGVGRALTQHFIEQYRDSCQWLQVGTQIANIPAMTLYQKMGFWVTRCSHVMHFHFAPPA